MRRIISIWLPQWATDRLQRATAAIKKVPVSSPSIEQVNAQPLALTAAVKNVQQVTAVNEAADAAGLSPGMTLTHARALVPDLPSAPADPEADAIGLKKLADWCGRYSPLSGVDHSDSFLGDDGLWIDVTGCTHLFGGEQTLVDDLDRRLTSLGLHHRLGLAETMGAAWAIARYRPGTPIAQRGDLDQALADLPAAGLRLSSDVVTLLRRLGLKRIGQLDAIPSIALARRFSSAEVSENVTHRLDQAFGRREELLTPRRPLPLYRKAVGLFEPIMEVPAMVQVLETLTSDLCRMMERAGQGAERLSLWAYRVDGDVARLHVGASQPTRDRHHIERLFSERLETINAGFGIDRVALHADRVAPLHARQMSLTSRIAGTDGQDEGLPQLVDRLANRLGSGAVRMSVPFASHLPERAERHVPAIDAAKQQKNWPNRRVAGTSRPSSLLPRPEPIAAMAEVPDGPPMRFTWRRVTRRIVKAEGPERIAPEWWGGTVGTADGVNLAGETRDYYRVEDEEGRRYWLFRRGLYDRAGYAGSDTEHQVAAAGHPGNAAERSGIGWFIHGMFG